MVGCELHCGSAKRMAHAKNKVVLFLKNWVKLRKLIMSSMPVRQFNIRELYGIFFFLFMLIFPGLYGQNLVVIHHYRITGNQ
jgi:hypothetical protein